MTETGQTERLSRGSDASVTRSAHDVDHAAKQVWASAIAQVEQQLVGARARRRYDALGEIAVGSTDLWLDRDVSISVSGPATFALSLILDGDVLSCLDGGEPLPITSGTAVIFACAGMISGTNQIRGGRRLRLVDMRFDKAFLESVGGVPLSRFARELFIDRSIPDRGATFVAFPASRELLAVGAQMIDCGFTEEGARKLFLQAKALEALALTIAALGRSAPSGRPLSGRDRDRLAEARTLLQERYDEPWTITTLARAVGLSERRLKEGFRATIGSSVHAYLTQVRLDAAAAMLSDGRSVTDVALSVGYGNLSHFSKVFREHHGVNPGSYLRTLPP